jgi:hypothetical protein
LTLLYTFGYFRALSIKWSRRANFHKKLFSLAREQAILELRGDAHGKNAFSASDFDPLAVFDPLKHNGLVG